MMAGELPSVAPGPFDRQPVTPEATALAGDAPGDLDIAPGEGPSGGRELLQVGLGLAVFVLVGPLILGAVLFFGVIVTTLVGDAIDTLALGRRFDPATSMVVATGLMLVLLRFGWLLVYGVLLMPAAAAGAVVALRKVAFGGASWRFAAATGVAVGLLADVAVVGYGQPLLGATRIGLFAGWVVLGSLVATLACWRIAGGIAPSRLPTSAQRLYGRDETAVLPPEGR